jgi:hypothetical protein
LPIADFRLAASDKANWQSEIENPALTCGRALALT